MRHILSIAEIEDIIDDSELVSKQPQQLVAVPLGALMLMAASAARIVGHPSERFSAVKAAVEVAEEVMPSTFKQHVPVPLPD